MEAICCSKCRNRLCGVSLTCLFLVRNHLCNDAIPRPRGAVLGVQFTAVRPLRILVKIVPLPIDFSVAGLPVSCLRDLVKGMGFMHYALYCGVGCLELSNKFPVFFSQQFELRKRHVTRKLNFRLPVVQGRGQRIDPA